MLALILLAGAPVQQASAQTPYSERLNAFVAGNSALWYFTFTGVNGSAKLSSLESAPGLSWYNITMVKTTSWQSDFQIFGPNGYGLLPFPFAPSEGMFLTVGSDSFADASAAASAADPFLLTTFVSYSNGTGSYTFYSPLSFNALAPATLLRFLPTSEGGFVAAISATSLESTDSPFVILEGQKSTSGFAHNLVVGSISASALDSTGKPTVLSYFGSTVATLKASSHSTSSVIQLKFLDGIVKSSDPAKVTSDNAHFTGSYTLTLAAGKAVSKVNATVVELPDPLLATRAVSVGVLHTNDNIAITLTLRNLAATETITKISFSDNWWNKTGVFKFLSGDSTAPTTGIAAGGSVTPVYRLQYTGTATGGLTIPASVVRYSYSVGGLTFNATAILNPIRLSLGADDAVIETTVSSIGGLGKSVGSPQTLNVTVTNVGTLPASSVLVAGQSIPGLAARSGTSTVTITESASSLTNVNVTKAYSTTYQNPAGTSLNSTSNVMPLAFSHTALKMGSPSMTVAALLATLSNRETNLTLSFATTNVGPVNITSFKATANLPLGLGCGTVSGKGPAVKGLACSNGVVSIDYPVINASSTLTAYMKYNLTSPANYLMGPMGFTAVTSKSNVAGFSNAVAIPAGLVLSKQFTPALLFGGMKASVEVKAVNSGPLAVYNATVVTTQDSSFDSLSGSPSLTKGPGNIAPGGNVTFDYGVTASKVSGNFTGTVVTGGFYFGGTTFSVKGAGPKVNVYQPIGVSISTSPATPEEGKNFTITIKVTNPTGVGVSNVLFKLPVPSGLGLSNLNGATVGGGVLIFSPGTLAPHSSATATASAVAGSGITIPFDKANITFQYAGSTIKGVLPKNGIAIAEDVTTRYIIPTAFILLAVLGVAFYVRWKARPSAPSSP
jgi:hypothetical protein